jgi:extradiol dioxygenase family protein
LLAHGRVEFKDLCLDVNDLATAARFWAPVLGLTAEVRDRVVLLADGVAGHAVWLNLVPEERSVKNRVHLDVHTPSIDSLVQRGARVVMEQDHWTVMADVEGGEFCAFVRESPMLPSYRLYELVVDAADPERIAGWWAERFGAVAGTDQQQGFSWVEPAGGLPWEMVFSPVPEPKTVKNRVHWNVLGEADALLPLGATLLRRRDQEIDWDVLADPEGNEFCVFDRR